jgi:uncharacterized phiE125 gp8 family phage protein
VAASLRRLSQATYPVLLSEAKEHLRLEQDCDANDAYVLSCIATASEWIAARCGRALTLGTYELILDRFPTGPVTLHVPPLYSPDPQLLVNFEDRATRAVRRVDAIIIDHDLDPKVAPVSGAWPTGGRGRIQWQAGYGTAADVPPQIRHAILMAITGFFDDRSGNALNTGSPLASTIEALLASVSTGFLAGGRMAADWRLDGNDLWADARVAGFTSGVGGARP